MHYTEIWKGAWGGVGNGGGVGDGGWDEEWGDMSRNWSQTRSPELIRSSVWLLVRSVLSAKSVDLSVSWTPCSYLLPKVALNNVKPVSEVLRWRHAASGGHQRPLSRLPRALSTPVDSMVEWKKEIDCRPRKTGSLGNKFAMREVLENIHIGLCPRFLAQGSWNPCDFLSEKSSGASFVLSSIFDPFTLLPDTELLKTL